MERVFAQTEIWVSPLSLSLDPVLHHTLQQTCALIVRKAVRDCSRSVMMAVKASIY